MPKKIEWDATGEHLFETGTDHGVLYPTTDAGAYGTGVAWNGLTGVTQSPSGAEATDLWADNIKYASLRSAEDFGGTIEAYTYPEEFNQCNGIGSLGEGVYIGQQGRRAFGFSWRTLIGNEIKGSDYGYKIHIAYGCTVSPSEAAHTTVNDSPDAVTMSWEFETVPVNVTDMKPTAHLEIDSTKIPKAKLTQIETALYGSNEADAHILMPDEIAAILAAA